MKNQAEQNELQKNTKRKLVLHFSRDKGSLELLLLSPD